MTEISSGSLLFDLGLMMMPATVLAYFHLGQFLMLVMVFSWLYSTFCFLSICTVIGPKDDFGQLSITRLFSKCGPHKVKPENRQETTPRKEFVNMEANVLDDLPRQREDSILLLKTSKEYHNPIAYQ